MAIAVIMPRQGQSVESCIISKWHKQKGDSIKAGELLFSYETDKASFEEEAKNDGVLLEIFFAEGDDVPCLTNVCVIGNPGESFTDFDPRAQTGDGPTTDNVAPVPTVQEAISEQQTTAPAEPEMTDGARIKISPRARNLAERTGLDFRYAQPTGPNGRIIEQDILTLRESGPVPTLSARNELSATVPAGLQGTGLGGRITTADLQAGVTMPVTQSPVTSIAQPEYEDVKLPNIRKVIAKAMHLSLSTTAQLTLNTSFDATEVMDFRKKLKRSQESLGLENITLNDIILFAVSRTLLGFKELNAHFLEDKIRCFKNVNLGVAVDTPRGLMVPTLFKAELKSLNQLSGEVKQLVKECQAGTINPDWLKDGSFTVTNLGTLGIESFTPVLNPPQTGILGVNTVVQRVREVDGEYQFYPALGLSLTFDHRALDGAPAAKFLQELKRNLENFSALLAR
jgi:pyruvate dehydrogenase E2 component (dihydrolipoamide acetyltransferase)